MDLHNGATVLVGAVQVRLAHLHLQLEAAVLGVEFLLALGLDLLNVVLEAPLEGLEDHVQSVVNVPLAGAEETQQQGI